MKEGGGDDRSRFGCGHPTKSLHLDLNMMLESEEGDESLRSLQIKASVDEVNTTLSMVSVLVHASNTL